MPTDCAITLVVDPDDSAACATAVGRLACLPHGRVVCHPTPGSSLTWLACDLLISLGKRFDALRAEHVLAQAWGLAMVWLKAEAIEHLFVLRAHCLQVAALEQLCALQMATGVHLWLISSCAGLTAAQRYVLNRVPFDAMSGDEFLQRWRRAARACSPPQTNSGRDAFPRVPGVDFPVFRAMCRRLLEPASFTVVDRAFTAALTETLTWLSTRRAIREQLRAIELDLDEIEDKIPLTRRDAERRLQLRKELDQAWFHFEGDARSQLNALTVSGRSSAETLVRLRAAQAGYFRFGLLLDVRVPPQALRGDTEFGSAIDREIADRLRGMCTPRLTAAATLALALNLGPNALASLRLGEIASSGSALVLRDGEQRNLPAHASALVRAQLIQRRGQGAADDDPLFCTPDGGPAGGTMLRRLLQQASRRLAIAIPSTTSRLATIVSWPVGHQLTLTRLPVHPLDTRRWTSV